MKLNKIFFAGLMALSMASCSDVDIPGFDSLDRVQNLGYSVNNKSVTLTWSAAANATKYIILQNGVQIAETDATSYTINKVEAGVEQAFTVKAVYADGKVSEGLTAYVTIEPTAITAFYGYIALGDFNSLDDDEQASYNWFKETMLTLAWARSSTPLLSTASAPTTTAASWFMLTAWAWATMCRTFLPTWAATAC